MYTVKMLVDYAHEKLPVIGTTNSYLRLQSADTSLLPYGYSIRIEIVNNSGNSWKLGLFGTFYREPPEPQPL